MRILLIQLRQTVLRSFLWSLSENEIIEIQAENKLWSNLRRSVRMFGHLEVFLVDCDFRYAVDLRQTWTSRL